MSFRFMWANILCKFHSYVLVNIVKNIIALGQPFVFHFTGVCFITKNFIYVPCIIHEIPYENLKFDVP